VGQQLQLALNALEGDRAAPAELSEGAGDTPSPDRRPPRGITVGRIVIAEGYRWTNLGYDVERREFVCKLIGGSGAVRRFRARAVRIERGDR
jgi:hypothetical protein